MGASENVAHIMSVSLFFCSLAKTVFRQGLAFEVGARREALSTAKGRGGLSPPSRRAVSIRVDIRPQLRT
jgi:hypothetical protein